MSQKHPHRFREHAANKRRQKAAELKRAKKEARVKAREQLEKQ